MDPSEGMIVGLLLAAGAGRRFDPDGRRLKLLERVPSGRQAGQRIAVSAALQLRNAVDRLIAVVAPVHLPNQATLHRCLAEAGCELVINESPERGLGRSISVGVAASAKATGWLVQLADLPSGSTSTAVAVRRALLAASAGTECVAPTCAGRRGHPVAFRSTLREELLALDGEPGARWVLERHPPLLLETQDPGCVVDVDRPEDLSSLPR